MATRISYKPLFSIECLHGYFAHRICRPLALNPTPDTAGLCQRYGLRFRSAPGGGALYYEESATNLSRLREETARLAFALTSSDPLFDIYTDGGRVGNGSPGGTVRYFSNRDPHLADVNGRQRLLLHPPEQPLAEPPLPVRPHQFTRRFDELVRSVDLQVLDANGQLAWQTRTPEFQVPDWPVDLRGRPCGRYRMVVAARPAETFYLSDGPAVHQWGILEIFLKDLQEVPTYTISFGSRATVWRYYIFDDPTAGSSYAGYNVVGLRKRSDNDGASGADIPFARQTEQVMVNGRPAVVFESTQPVPLAEVPSGGDYSFTLRPNGNSERSGQSIKLPFAQPVSTKPDARPDGMRMVSDIFVYL